MVNDVIGHVTSKFLKNLCKIFLFSSKNIRQHFFVKYVKTKHSFGPNGRKNHKIYRRVQSKLFLDYTFIGIFQLIITFFFVERICSHFFIFWAYFHNVRMIEKLLNIFTQFTLPDHVWRRVLSLSYTLAHTQIILPV